MVVRISGEVDVVNADEVQEQLCRAIDASPGSTVEVDLSAVPFMDSSGLGALVWGYRRAKRAGGDLTLIGVQPVVAKVLRITGLDQVIHVVSG